MQNSVEIFELALGHAEPWYLERIESKGDGSAKELHIQINFKKGFKFARSGGEPVSAHDTQQRTW